MLVGLVWQLPTNNNFHTVPNFSLLNHESSPWIRTQQFVTIRIYYSWIVWLSCLNWNINTELVCGFLCLAHAHSELSLCYLPAAIGSQTGFEDRNRIPWLWCCRSFITWIIFKHECDLQNILLQVILALLCTDGFSCQDSSHSAVRTL